MCAKKKCAISDVAREANVSKTTVSFYLNGKRDKMTQETWDRVAATVKKFDYRPSSAARMLGAEHSELIGVVIGDITNSFSNHLVKGIDSVCRENNYQILIGNSEYTPEIERRHIERMIDMRVDGVILQPTQHPHEVVSMLESAGVRVVCIDSNPAGVRHWVVTDNYHASYDSVCDCVDIGYDNCIMFSAPPDVLTSRRERYRGCIDALLKKGANCQAEIIDASTPEEQILSTVQSGLSGRTLVFVPNCWLLPHVYSALQPLRSLIPKQLGLLGFDNEEWAGLADPSVSTIVQPAWQEGATAAALLIDVIRENSLTPGTAVLTCETVWRSSTCAL